MPAIWDEYQPHTEWYLSECFGLHGIGHSARVLVWANLIGAWMRERGIDVDLECVRWSASLHDVRRVNQGSDPLHGSRCAQWLADKQNLAIVAIGRERWARMAYCCEWHVPPDSEAPEITPELVCLKDADALDRARLGGLNAQLLRTAFAKRLTAPAQFLCDLSEVRTEYRNNPWDAVRRVGLQMGTWGIQQGTAEICKGLRYCGW